MCLCRNWPGRLTSGLNNVSCYALPQIVSFPWLVAHNYKESSRCPAPTTVIIARILAVCRKGWILVNTLFSIMQPGIWFALSTRSEERLTCHCPHCTLYFSWEHIFSCLDAQLHLAWRIVGSVYNFIRMVQPAWSYYREAFGLPFLCDTAQQRYCHYAESVCPSISETVWRLNSKFCKIR